jgi:hypothetical protein
MTDAEIANTLGVFLSHDSGDVPFVTALGRLGKVLHLHFRFTSPVQAPVNLRPLLLALDQPIGDESHIMNGGDEDRTITGDFMNQTVCVCVSQGQKR